MFEVAFRALLGIFLLGPLAVALDATDMTLDGVSEQSGYYDNHNMDPAMLEAGSFGQLWRYKTPDYTSGSGAEQFYAKPLVYTPKSYGKQIILTFSEQNRLFALDAVNGTLVAFRDMNEEGEGPFSVSEFGGNCNDIADTIGITGTPVIDDSTETVYFWAKSYTDETTSGLYNGAYRFHAVDAVTLAERSGYPVLLDGHQADNDATRYFQGGIQLQRTALNLLNGVVYAGFGGHCDLFNYTGWVVGMSASDGHFVTAYATSAGQGAPAVPNTSGSGVWMSGAILSSDQPNRLFFSTGNGYTSTINGASPASGRVTLATLSEAIVNMGINSDGTLYQQDYFEPAAYSSMDGADRDVGSGGVALLPFSGGGVETVAVACGKNGQCFIMDADNLGGYKNGANQGDNILQTITPPSGAAMFATVSCYPLEGGYMYIAPSGAPIYAYALGHDSSGRPQFSYAGETATITTGRVAISGTVVTSLSGQEGSGILWIVDPDMGIGAYEAVPSNGILTPITLPASGLVSKFQRLAFGDGRYYTTSAGYVLAYGSPVTLPLNCTGPLNFGEVPIGSSATQTLTCTALINTIIESTTIGSIYYKVTNSSHLPATLTAGQSFNFSVTFNLTGYSADGSSGTKLGPGVKPGALTITTNNSVAEYASTQPISLTGEAVTDAAYPSVNPLQVDFTSVVVTNTSDGEVSSGASENTFVLANLGEAAMSILGYGYTTTDPLDDDTTFVNVTTGDDGTEILDSNGYFTSSSLPAIGSTMAAGTSVVATVDFNTNIIGSYFTILVIWTTGGMVYVTLEASAASQPAAAVYYSSSEGGWNLIPNSPDIDEDWTYTVDFGTGPGGTDQTIEILVANIGGSDLIITKSKSPEGTYLAATNPDGELAEGLVISPGSNATATIYFEPPTAQLNSLPVTYAGAWTLNVNDLIWGVHVLNFTGTIQGTQVGPKLADGTARFKWLGCYLDSTASRIESSTTASSNDSNGWCQEQAYEHTYAFAGTEYMDECYYGNSIPSSSLKGGDSSCTGYACAGDSTQSCGGPGGYMSLWYDVTAYFPNNGSLAPAYQPPSQPAVVGDYNYIGCYGDDTASRALSGKAPGLGTSNSLEACAAACAGYTYFGTEYGNECYCGNTINVESGSGISGKLQTSGCTVICAASTNEYCGGSARLSMYALNGTKTSSSSLSSSAGSTEASSATGSTGSATSTTSRVSTTSSTAASPTVSISCPDSNGTVYTALNGATFMLECYVDRQGGDLAMGYSGWSFDLDTRANFKQHVVLVGWLNGVVLVEFDVRIRKTCAVDHRYRLRGDEYIGLVYHRKTCHIEWLTFWLSNGLSIFILFEHWRFCLWPDCHCIWLSCHRNKNFGSSFLVSSIDFSFTRDFGVST